MYALTLLLKQFAFESSPALTSIWHQISINAHTLQLVQQITILHIVRGTRFISGCTTPHCSLRRFTVADIIRCAARATGHRLLPGGPRPACLREKSLRYRRESLRQVRKESLRPENYAERNFAVRDFAVPKTLRWQKFAALKVLRSETFAVPRNVCGVEVLRSRKCCGFEEFDETLFHGEGSSPRRGQTGQGQPPPPRSPKILTVSPP